MPTLARPLRSLAVLPLVAALASTVPAVRWCAMPWSAITLECFTRCETGEVAARVETRATSCDAMPCGTTSCGTTPCGPGESRPCTGEPDGSSSGSPCAREAVAGDRDGEPAGPGAPARSGPRAFCIEAPPAATPGPGSENLLPPALPAGVLAAVEVPEPAVARPRREAFEPLRPRWRPPGLPPPVRGPPFEA